MYAHIKNGEIDRFASLPKVLRLEDGQTISGFNLLPHEVHKSHGWLPVEEVVEEYDTDTHYATNPQTEVQENKVVRTWEVAQIPQDDQEGNYSDYLVDIDFRLSMVELGL
ncbi:hypothetical protein FLK61_34065 [Paenalkalicoccus suaedae]|uniref:Uncharacterized protein n=1 Tax=Paenalkalicoccus suaedae TaxID=2592382 RepID=A0A859FBR9_9BACI|nr:hypothetical protein [Paenalkalicoccus suaedae]QKS70268.1 hypothetical protein FLK61_26265 [Paenalkalicoccus suaedae]QKS71653.1 hypothetical protein FLK61_33770 [Paenalkalicoccus suaedae]QKS71707.1 hypothetical protein FLK61_34065 [Paenalkalicoccus suaedae]